MIIGVCLYSMVLSILSSLFEDFQTKEKNNKKNIYLLDELRNKYHIPEEIYHKVLRYLKYTSVINSKDNNLLMNSLPKYYKCALLYEIHGESLNNINIFKGQSNEFKFQSVLFLKELNLIKGEFLIQSGDIVEEFYMVKKGILQIQKETNYIKIKILKIREKEHFGEIYMTSGIPMPFDITGYSKFCELFYFKKSDFITLYEDFPKEIEKILNLSWKNTIRIEMRAKMLFEKAENENYHNLSLTASNNEKKNIKNKDKYYNNKLTVIHEECISSNFNNTLQNEEEENSFKRTHNHLTNKNMIKVKSKERNNLNLDNSNGNIKNNNLNQVKNNTSLNNNKLKTKNKDKILKSTIQLKSKLSDYLKIKNLRRASTPLNIKSFNIKTKNPVKKYNKFFNSMKKTSIFHLPLINFSNGNENLSDSEIKNKKKFNKQKSISQTIKPKLSKKQINNYNVNLNLNIENNYNSNNLEKSNSVHKKKDTMNLILKNLKGLSENLKNPTSFFRNYENNHVSAFMSSKNEINLKNNSIISKVNKNLIDNMNIHIDKIDKIYEKIITSLLEKYMKNQKK
jgi:CRP-like cAMP-binding protein